MSPVINNRLRIRGEGFELLDPAGMPLWFVSIGSIVLVAEYTTNEGPYADDYFLIFVTIENGRLSVSTCSFYSLGRDEILTTLRERLNSAIELELQGSTEWQSRVVWPIEMAGIKYFTFSELPAKTLGQKLKKRVLGPTQEYTVSQIVREYLNEQLRSHV